jgi:hypothetical protein
MEMMPFVRIINGLNLYRMVDHLKVIGRFVVPFLTTLLRATTSAELGV